MSVTKEKPKQQPKRQTKTDRDVLPVESPATPKPEQAEPLPEQAAPVGARWPRTRGGRVSLKILVFLGILWSVYVAKAVLFPIVLAVVLYFLLSPLTRSLARLHVPPVASAAVVVLGCLLILGVGIYFLYLPASEMVVDLPNTLRKADRKLWVILKPVNEASTEITKLTKAKDEDGSELQEVQVRQPPLTYVLFTFTGGIVMGGMVVIILLFLLLATGHRTLNSIIELIPGIRNKHGVVRMLRNVETSISNYIVTVTLINIGLGAVIGCLMALLGMPNPILIGIMAAALNFIPYLGCIVGTTITFLTAVVAMPTATEAILPPLLYLMINSLEGTVLTPMILGKRMSMNPVLVFLSLVVWGWMWGVGGALIAVPVLGIAAIACSHFDSLQPVARFISGVSRAESGETPSPG